MAHRQTSAMGLLRENNTVCDRFTQQIGQNVSLIPPTVLVLERGELSVTVGGNRAGTNVFEKKVGKFLPFLFLFLFFFTHLRAIIMKFECSFMVFLQLLPTGFHPDFP